MPPRLPLFRAASFPLPRSFFLFLSRREDEESGRSRFPATSVWRGLWKRPRPLRIPRRKIESRSRRNRFAPLPPEGQSIAPVCVQASRESRFHDAIEIARAVSLIFFAFFSPLPPSLARALIQKISAARQVAPVDARSRLPDSTNFAAIHLSTSLRPTYRLPLPST